MTSPSAADVVRAVYAAFGRGDAVAVFALCAPDTVWTMNGPKEHPYAGVFRGVAGVGRFLGALASTVEVLDFGVDEEHVAGTHVVCVGHERLRARATGREVSNRWIHVFRVDGGRVARFEEWYDPAPLLAALAR